MIDDNRANLFMKAMMFACVMVALALSTNAAAQGTYVGNLVEVWVEDYSAGTRIAWVNIQSDMQTPACTNKQWFVLDLSNESMTVAYGSALAAHLAGRQVRLRGNGTCFSVGPNNTYEYLKAIAVL